MRMLTFAGRNAKEILRDPLTILFGLGFPLILLLLLSAIQANIPVSLFEIQSLAPGITVFGLSFITLFSATVLAKDRSSSLLQRLYTTPLTPVDFILGYTLPILPMMAATGVTGCSVEEKVDPYDAVGAVGGKTVLVGNVGSVRPLFMGTPEEVVEGVKKSMDAGFNVLSSGCGIAVATPNENMLAFSKTVKGE